MDRLLSEQEVIKAVNKHTIPSAEIILSEDITAILKEVSSAEPKWIPVSERLPDEETNVLVYCETGAITVCCGSYSTEVSDTFIWYTGGWRYGKVIAWMPLPEPYKAGSEDKE